MNRISGVHSLTGKRYNYTAPENWNEVDEHRLVGWAAICLKKLRLGDAIRLAMVVFYKISPVLFFLIPESQKVQLGPTLSFLFGKNKLVKWVIKTLYIGLKLPFFNRHSTCLYGPEDRLSNLTIGEFRRTEIYYQAWTKTNDLKYLHLLIATLYRPKRKGIIDQDIREPLTEYGIRKRAEKVKKISRKKQHAILLNYEGCRGYILDNYLSKLPKSGAKKESELFDFNDLILSVAGGKFGAFKETESALLYDFLKHLIDTAEEVARIKQKK